MARTTVAQMREHHIELAGVHKVVYDGLHELEVTPGDLTAAATTRLRGLPMSVPAHDPATCELCRNF